MAVAVDASTPAIASANPSVNQSITTASFTPPNNSLLVAAVLMEATSAVGPGWAFSGGGSWTNQVDHDWDEAFGNSFIAIATQYVPTGGAGTVSWTRPNNTGGGNGIRTARLKVWVLTGVDSGTPVDSIGANNEGGSTTNNLTTSSLTAGANGLLMVAAANAVGTGAGGTTSSDLTADFPQYTGQFAGQLFDGVFGYKAVTSGATVNANLNAQGTGSVEHDYCQIIVREAAAGGGLVVNILSGRGGGAAAPLFNR